MLYTLNKWYTIPMVYSVYERNENNKIEIKKGPKFDVFSYNVLLQIFYNNTTG